MRDLALPRAGGQERPDGRAPLEARRRYLKRHHSTGVDWVSVVAAVLLVWAVLGLIGFVR